MDQIRAAFSRDPSIADRIQGALSKHRDQDLAILFSDIVAYITDAPNGKHEAHDKPQPANKKRKLETIDEDDGAAVFECKDISFTMPARKKMKLDLLSSGQIRLTDPKTELVEWTLNKQEVWQVFCLPVPEKAQRQQNFVILHNKEKEQVVFTINEAPDKANLVVTRSKEQVEGETLASTVTKELESFGLEVCKPDAREFASSISEPHRKGEKAYHVKAHRGAKQGYLYFLSTGILFGFKKPLFYYPFGDIDSISYTSVLQRTFNLVITDQSYREAEFSMLDQADFAGIDGYIKAHGLNDASMAAERRAKMYNVNKKKDDAEQDSGAPGDQTELERAEQQLQDEEDEEEEDYDPSGGESDGEGEDSDGSQQDDGHQAGDDEDLEGQGDEQEDET